MYLTPYSGISLIAAVIVRNRKVAKIGVLKNFGDNFLVDSVGTCST